MPTSNTKINSRTSSTKPQNVCSKGNKPLLSDSHKRQLKCLFSPFQGTTSLRSLCKRMPRASRSVAARENFQQTRSALALETPGTVLKEAEEKVKVEHWRAVYERTSPSIEMPASVYPVGTKRSLQKSAVETTLPACKLSELEALSDTTTTSFTSTLSGAFAILVARICKQTELMVGVGHAQEGNVNFLPLPLDLGHVESVRDVLRCVEEAMSETSQHALAADTILRELQLGPAGELQLLFPVGLVESDGKLETKAALQGDELENLSLVIEVVRPLPGAENADLTIRFHYDTGLYSTGLVEILARTFTQVLDSLCCQPETPWTHIALVSASETQQLTVGLQAPVYPLQAACVHQLFEEQAATTPSASAITCGGTTLTYLQLEQRTRALALKLKRSGVCEGSLVGVCMHRCTDLVVALIAIMRTGAAYVPLDPSFPADRLQYIVEHSGVKVMLAHTTLDVVSQLSDSADQVISMEEVASDLEESEEALPTVGHVDSSLMYTMYTSGSTGNPKGVALPHTAVAELLASMKRRLGLAQGDQWVSLTTVSFDISVLEMFGPLTSGAELIFLGQGDSADPAKIISAVSNSLQRDTAGDTVVQATPSTWNMLLQCGWEVEAAERQRLQLLTGGEALPRPVGEALVEHAREVWNVYGPTETAIWSTTNALHEEVQRSATAETTGETEPFSRGSNIGKPLDNETVYVLDNNQELMPQGLAGELFIGGHGLADGYLHQPELSAERFVPNPYDKQGGRMYKTGDLVTWTPEGELLFLGRLDNQVKLRGFRIELGDIESALERQPAVKAAAVVIRGEPQQLVGYVTLKEGHDGVSPSDLRAACSDLLPYYMVPTTVMLMDSLPQTPNGKIDRKALPEPEISSSGSAEEPTTATEKQLCKIWAAVLKLDSVGIADNFFDLGGNSIAVAQVAFKIEQVMDRKIQLPMLIAHPTVAELAAHIDSRDPDAQPEYQAIVPLRKRPGKPTVYCVHPAGGHIISYMQLLPHFQEEFSFYGIQAYGLEEGQEIMTSVPDTAAIYVDEIIKQQELDGAGPEVPIHVAGWSYGGVLAYEVAQQLQRKGYKMGMLGLIDSWCPVHLSPDVTQDTSDEYLVGVLCRYYGGVFGRDDLVPMQQYSHLPLKEQMEIVISEAVRVGVLPSDVSKEQFMRIADVLRGTLVATFEYSRTSPLWEQRYEGDVVVFRANERHKHANNPRMVWVEVMQVINASAEPKVFPVTGSHYRLLLEPHAQLLAEQMEEALRPYLDMKTEN